MHENNHLNLKNVISENAVNTLISYVDSKIDSINQDFSESNSQLIGDLSEEISLSALSPLNLDIYKEERKRLTRFNYSFPSFINLGKLKNWHSTPSKILKDKYFLTEVPMIIPIERNGVAFFMNPKFKREITDTMELIALKLLSSLPDGLVRLTIIDKNGSGQNFPTLLMLGDKITDQKILSEDHEIESEMLELKNSITTIAQSITANGFSSIEEYNKKTKEIPQIYKLIFISNFPAGFTKKSAEALVALLESGSNAGIYVFFNITSDPKYGMNQQIAGISLIEFLKNVTLFEYQTKPHDYTRRGFLKHNINMFNTPMNNDSEIKKFFNSSFKIDFEELDSGIASHMIADLNDRIQQMNLRPIIKIENTIPKDFWTEKAGKGVCAPFGKSGIENVYLSLGINQFGEDESTHHGIIGGATGSGKTVTLHDMILHLCMRYSPKDLIFWLLDYKEGTEFAVYKDFPYVQILSMESEIEFGQEVLLKAINLMESRGKLFKSVGAANLHNYNNLVSEEEKLPRIILIIDEFQALFPKKAQVTAITNERIDRILRLGRSFGINLLLSTQTLKGVDMDPQLLSNMPLRIALKMDEKDTVKLFGDNNVAPKYLKYPGEGIYNKSYGNSTSNVHFQAYFSEGIAIESIQEELMKKMENTYKMEDLFNSRFVYSGESPGNIENNSITLNNTKLTESNKFYIGEPAGLSKEHSFLKFQRDFADNLFVVGLDLVAAASFFYYLVEQLCTISANKPIIYFGNFNNSYKENYRKLTEKYDLSYFDNSNTEEIIEEIYLELEARTLLSEQELKEKDSIFLINFFIENSKVFNLKNSYSKDPMVQKLNKIIHEGPEYGIHTALYATNYNTIMNVDMIRELEKFRKKVSLRGGNSLKILGDDNNDITFSMSKHVSIAVSGVIGEKPFKFKPYINHDFIVNEE